ncbi:phosphoribosylformylglycinamidine cyclo-ligase [Candidatus Daviesbacteria bacterium RIFCSPHIGHO2_02_FULL_41_10]|uniref:Phosphoribosylformylglycinamidine cyclo-ligase n=2 Tax=Candidatus Daviesiibacteriota TaxID=1752718 RepID=A0A1F5ISJ1_9BACT|nr:MAG: phosphoribosylformylglycinamidine cyclo-ligase [Candidatus Daviesbacteria bacterium RIFCSPHIGHO2_01_FULL_41_23]OGE33348.1 MAG: phosphoribosylformylglycinamidine cyclo-ligase [Candidatus Daviesbacteria bacterium RIFCSPHIGHO2_02_FULL_41_10]
MKSKINYAQTGVNYSVMDPLKKLAQQMGKQTSANLINFQAKEVGASRGESAFVWEEENSYRAFVIEGLGTKNLVADEMEKITGKTYYDSIAQDTIAAIVNDIITVGAMPEVINAYFGSGGPEWFADTKRSSALVEGWAKACQTAGATWGGGETPGLSGIINPDTLDLVGACIGIIKPKERLTLGDKLAIGDVILLIKSSGIHANGLSLARAVAKKLPGGYATKLPDGTAYGETILTPTYLYVSLIKDLFDGGVDIHYMANITGHGWRKLMRANKNFTYLITQIPSIPQIFDFIKEHSDSSDEDMYGNFNMGAGFAIYLPANQVEKAQAIAEKNNLKSWNAGVVQAGPKQVIIQPKNITFAAETLGVR